MSFRLLNSIDISDGPVTRRITLYEGELTAIPAEHRADILIVSAFPNDYIPTSSSLIGALQRKGLSVAQLAAAKAYDLRTTSAFWLSHPIGGAAAAMNIGQIACFEPQVRGAPPALVGDLFRGLFPFLDEKTHQVVAMPLLATGDQGWPPEVMLRSILDAAAHWLSRGLAITELMIVERRADRAAVLTSAMEDFKSGLSAAKLVPTTSVAYDVFLSFSSHDIDAADCVKVDLQKRGDARRIFDFRLEIDKGASWQYEIDRAISSSKAVVAILSPTYFASPECREELMQARLRNKRSDHFVLFPIYWRDWGKELDLWLQTINYADCREGNHQALTNTVSKLSFL